MITAEETMWLKRIDKLDLEAHLDGRNDEGISFETQQAKKRLLAMTNAADQCIEALRAIIHGDHCCSEVHDNAGTDALAAWNEANKP